MVVSAESFYRNFCTECVSASFSLRGVWGKVGGSERSDRKRGISRASCFRLANGPKQTLSQPMLGGSIGRQQYGWRPVVQASALVKIYSQ